MARELQNRVLDLIDIALDTSMAREVCPPWLRRPGRAESRDLWPTMQAIFADLTGRVLPDEMPPRERRSIDGVLTTPTAFPASLKWMKSSISRPHGHAPSPFIRVRW